MNDLSNSVPQGPPRGLARLRADVAVLGAGVAGLIAAHDLNQIGLSVTVIDRASRCGGTHRSHDIGLYTFDSGSIFFEENHPFFACFDGLKERCPSIFRSQGRIGPDGQVRHYPFDMREVLTWPLGVKLRSAVDLVVQRLASGEPKQVEAFCLARLGRTGYDRSGLSHYIERFHHERPAEIDVLFCQRRMQLVMEDSKLSAIGAAVLRLLAGRPAIARPRLALRVRPRGGFDEIYGEVRRRLEARGVTFLMGAPVTGIARADQRIKIESPAGVLSATHVVGAMPIDTLHRIIFGTTTGLEGIGLLTLFLSVSRIEGFGGNVLFNFHPRGRWKRATIYSRIYGRVYDREYFAVEITQRRGEAKDAEAAFEAFRRDVAGLGVFSEDLVLEGSDFLENAYPLYRKGCGPAVSAAIDRLSAFGIVPVGRQGRFAYLPVSSQVIARTRDQLGAAGFNLTTPASGGDS